jgi:ATP citrate (pro-S)-lyase
MDAYGQWLPAVVHQLFSGILLKLYLFICFVLFSSDTVCDLGGASELANYGEYSGDPSETQTYEYAKTILSLMTEGAPKPDGKVLIIGGSIANFTNVAMTFKV